MSTSSRSAIKKFVIDNTSTSIPSGVTLWQTITALRYEPKIEKLGGNIYCWIGETQRRVTRLSLGRGGGQKQADWSVQVYVIGTATDEQNGIDQFQAIVDNIGESYETIDLSPPPTITDPVDGGQSVVLIIGETWTDIMYRPEMASGKDANPASGRVVFRAVITLPVTEYLAQA